MFLYDRTSSCFLLLPVAFPTRGRIAAFNCRSILHIQMNCLHIISNGFFLVFIFRLKILGITSNIICCNRGTGVHLNWHTLALCNLRKCFPGRRCSTYYVFNIIVLPNHGIDPETGCASRSLISCGFYSGLL